MRMTPRQPSRCAETGHDLEDDDLAVPGAGLN
jgi:hypothetical protein